jgi:hypothetical protein
MPRVRTLVLDSVAQKLIVIVQDCPSNDECNCIEMTEGWVFMPRVFSQV